MDGICIFAVKDGVPDVSSVIISSLGRKVLSPEKLRICLNEAIFDMQKRIRKRFLLDWWRSEAHDVGDLIDDRQSRWIDEYVISTAW